MKKSKITYKQSVALTIFALIGILVIVFGAYSYYDYRKECQERAGREAEIVANRVVAQVNERLDNLRQYYISSVEEDEIRWVLENDISYADYSHYKGAFDAMACRSFFNGYVSGFTFVNYRTGWVLNNKGMFPLEETYNQDMLQELFDSSNGGIDKNYWNYDSTFSIENTVDRKYRVTVETEGLNFIMRLPSYSYNVYGMLIVNLNMNTWKQWMQEWISQNEELVVLDEEGDVIYSSNSRLTAECQNIQQKYGDAEMPRQVTGDGVPYMVSSSQSGILNWNYYVLHDIRTEQNVSTRFSSVFLILMVLLLAVCFWLVTYMIYHPISNLMRDFSQGMDKKSVGNELDFLAGSFRNLKEDKQALQGLLEQQQDKLLELFELRLVRGEVRSEDEWTEYIEDFHLRSWKYFATAVVVLNLRGEEETQSNFSEDAICLKIVQELPQEIKNLAWMPPIYNACTIFGLFAEDDENALVNKITEFYKNLQEHAESMYGYRILMGVSATHTDHKHIRAAYRESINALTASSHKEPENEGIPQQENAIQDCNFYLASTTMHDGSYDNSFEKEIQSGIKTIDKIQCYKTTDEFTHYLAERGGSQDENMIFILRYVNSILLTALEARVDLNMLYPDGLRKVYREVLEVTEPSRERRYIKANFIDPIIEARSELLENRSYSMMEEIEKRIAEKKGDITLTECADAMGVHPTYIWKILKMEKGKAFSDYLEEYKLEEAKRLLLRTNMTVAEIATELNYTNAQNFIRFFSKSTGVTPGKFRKLY